MLRTMSQVMSLEIRKRTRFGEPMSITWKCQTFYEEKQIKKDLTVSSNSLFYPVIGVNLNLQDK